MLLVIETLHLIVSEPYTGRMDTTDLDLRSFPAASEYLADIYLIQRDYQEVSNARLARWLSVSSPAVTQAVGRLKKIGLVDQIRYGNVVLTEKGKAAAVAVLKRHYLLEHVLVNLLSYPWDKADEEARVLQSHISKDLEDHIDLKLGYPQTCPHGNPMPGVAMERELLSAPRLDSVKTGDTLVILRITEEGEALDAMLPFCQARNIKPGSNFRVEAATAESISLQSTGNQTASSFAMPPALAKHIGVRITSST